MDNYIFNKIIQSIKNPIFFFYKLQNLYFYIKYTKNYNHSFYQNDQNLRFKKLNLSRKKGLEKIEKLKKKYQFYNSPMSSEHQIFFASISLKKNVKKILEIGTYDGVNAYQLSLIFPKSEITTIDLESDSEEFKGSYGRNEINKRKIFCDKRNAVLKKSKNVKFIEKNSIKLTFEYNKYDLIWVDGAHGNPIVTIDIINSLRLLNKNGIIACDDIFINKNTEPKNISRFNIKIANQMFSDLGAYETLCILRDTKLINFNLIYKRIDKINNGTPSRRKYIAILKKI